MTRERIQQRDGYIEVPGGRVWYQVVGTSDAIPLLTLHGGPGAASDHLAPLRGLADERPVVFYDQLGGGKSDQPNDDRLWRIERFVEEVATVRRVLDLQQVHLFGQSWGAMLAIDYILTQPDGVSSLILADPVVNASQWVADARRLRAQLPNEVQDVLDRHEAAGTLDSAEYQAATMEYSRCHFCRLDPWPEELTSIPLAMSVFTTMWGQADWLATGNLRHYDRTNQLHAIMVPTLFICGRYDPATPETITRYHHLVQGSELAIFEQSAHLPQWEETGRFLTVVRDFLNRAEQRTQGFVT